jgi:putative GTP pyrophosphokinase
MLDIKDEIKDAQKLFEVKSALVSTIMNDILYLMSLDKLQEASRYQNQLNKLIEYGDVSDLNNLHMMVKKEINRFR